MEVCRYGSKLPMAISQTFAGVMSEFCHQCELEGMFVIDAAFYNEPNINAVSSLRWLSRVPQTLKQAKSLTLMAEPPDGLKACACELEDYKLWEIRQSDGGIEQRWVLVECQTRKASQDLWAKELQKLETQLNRQLKKLSKTTFACKPDAYEALLAFEEQLELHKLVKVKIKTIRTKRQAGESRTTASKGEIVGYRISATLQVKPESEEQLTRQRS
jgi:transposase